MRCKCKAPVTWVVQSSDTECDCRSWTNVLRILPSYCMPCVYSTMWLMSNIPSLTTVSDQHGGPELRGPAPVSVLWRRQCTISRVSSRIALNRETLIQVVGYGTAVCRAARPLMMGPGSGIAPDRRATRLRAATTWLVSTWPVPPVAGKSSSGTRDRCCGCASMPIVNGAIRTARPGPSLRPPRR